MPKKRLYIPRKRKRVPQKGQLRINLDSPTNYEIWNGKKWETVFTRWDGNKWVLNRKIGR